MQSTPHRPTALPIRLVACGLVSAYQEGAFAVAPHASGDHPSSIHAIDWVVIALYGLGMLLTGLYYARRNKTVSDYALGGRSMNAIAVGLSLFATLLSTLSYLAWPGEMIKYGPMILLGYAAYPLVYCVVGWFIIPRIMRLSVTSAYEILETRLGLDIRLLGAALFLSLRLLWMSSIVYWSTKLVLLPAAGLDERYAVYFTVALSALTVAYTSLGGLRAVVATDVIQTAILFVGAIVSLGLITHSLGGVSAWFPTHWMEHWPTPELGLRYSTSSRATLATSMLAAFTWYVCTAGSDQMAIQRYLATRDVRAARRTLAVSLSTNVVVVIFLALMGLALLAFFTAHPEQLELAATPYEQADRLFTRFVIVGLPAGMSGLVVAGLLAAAMSSLSSGLNSSAVVITEDLWRRLRRTSRADAANEQTHLRQVRIVSVGIGAVCILLSSQMERIDGNMLEVVNKVANLLVAPLFFLFFMAIFVPWAERIGTWCGVTVGLLVAIVIAFFSESVAAGGISFLWMMPASFIASALVGCTISGVACQSAPRRGSR